MADELPASISCGEGASGYAESLSPPSSKYGWTVSAGYGQAVGLCKAELNKLDDLYKTRLAARLDKWIEDVSCLASAHCASCKKSKTNHVTASDVESDDIVHKSGNINHGLVSVERLYWVASGFVDCVCPHQVSIHTEEEHRALAKKRKDAREHYIHARERSHLIGVYSED